MELTDFLVARIAEDEAATFELVPYRCEPGCCAPAGFVGHRCLICGTEEFGGTVDAITDIAREHDEKIHRRSRVLAECNAKQRIVAWHRLIDGLDTDDNPVRGCGNCIASGAVAPYLVAGPCITVRLLGLPYAGHPDYREEWRV